MLKKILLAVVIIALIGGGLVAYEWFKPHKNAATAKVDVAIAATDLAKEYGANESSANTKYLNKNIEVSGMVSEVNKNQDGGVMAVLETGDPMSGVQCTMRDKDVVITKGQNVTIKGFCSGYNMGVALTDCVIKK